MNTPHLDRLLAKLLELGVKKDEVVLVGSVPLAIRDVRDVRDLDVLCDLGVIERIEERHGKLVHRDMGLNRGYAAAWVDGDMMIQMSAGIENFASTVDLTNEEVREGAEDWKGWKVLSFMHCVKIKRALRRDKDLDDLHLLEGMKR